MTWQEKADVVSGVSIGPRLFRHGNSKKIIDNEGIYPGFNWATSFQTWKWCVLGRNQKESKET